MGKGLMLLFLSMILISFAATVSLANSQDHRFGINIINGTLASPVIINTSDPMGSDHTLYIINSGWDIEQRVTLINFKKDNINNPKMVWNQKEVGLLSNSFI
jgi:hypothetical protein